MVDMTVSAGVVIGNMIVGGGPGGIVVCRTPFVLYQKAKGQVVLVEALGKVVTTVVPLPASITRVVK